MTDGSIIYLFIYLIFRIDPKVEKELRKKFKVNFFHVLLIDCLRCVKMEMR